MKCLSNKYGLRETEKKDRIKISPLRFWKSSGTIFRKNRELSFAMEKVTASSKEIKKGAGR